MYEISTLYSEMSHDLYVRIWNVQLETCRTGTNVWPVTEVHSRCINDTRKKAWTEGIYAIFRSFELNINKTNRTFLTCKFSDQTSVPFLHLFNHIRTKFFEVDTLCSCTRYFLCPGTVSQTCKYFTLGVCPIVVLWPSRIWIHFLGKSNSLITTFTHFPFHDSNKESTVGSIYNVIKWC